jgi:hypothetical protein
MKVISPKVVISICPNSDYYSVERERKSKEVHVGVGERE